MILVFFIAALVSPFGIQALFAQESSGFKIGDKVLVALNVIGTPDEFGVPNHQGEITGVAGDEVDVMYWRNGYVNRHRIRAKQVYSALRPSLEVGRLKNESLRIGSIAFSKDGTKLVSLVPGEQRVRIWDVQSLQVSEEFKFKYDTDGEYKKDDITAAWDHFAGMQFGKIWLDADGSVLVRVRYKLFIIPQAANRQRIAIWPDQITDFSVSPDGRMIALLMPAERNNVGHTVQVKLFDPADLFAQTKEMKGNRVTFKTDPQNTAHVALTNNLKLLVVASRPKDATSYSQLAYLFDSSERLNHPREKPVGDAITVGTFQRDNVELTMLVHGNQLYELVPKDTGNPLDDSAEIKVRATLADMADTATPDGSAYDPIFLGERPASRTGHDVIHAAFAPDGRWLVTAHSNGQLMFFDTTDGRQLATFPSGGKTISALAVSPDGKIVATAEAPEITLWSVEKILAEKESKKNDLNRILRPLK